MWGINNRTESAKKKKGRIMFLLKSSGLQRFLLGLCLGVEDRL